MAILTAISLLRRGPIATDLMQGSDDAPETPPTRARRLRWRRSETLILVALIAFAAFLRFYAVSAPATLVFDETYYAKDGCLYAGLGQEACDSPAATEQSYVHPPVAKWLIAAGIRAFGNDSFGWRFSAALFGTATVALVFLLARKLFIDRWIAAVAGLLAASDFLLIVQSRIAMLDIFLTFFVVLGFLLLAYDRERVSRLRDHLRATSPSGPPRREPEWRYAAGAVFGLAVASKWSGGFALIIGLLMALAWSAGYFREARRLKVDPPVTERREALNTVLALMVVPLVVYLFSYAHWFADNLPFTCDENAPPGCREGVVASGVEFVKLQKVIFDFHAELEATHNYESKAWKWPLVLRPIAYYYAGPPERPESHHILAFGNPVVWWAALAAAAYMFARGRRSSPDRFVLAAWWGQYAPWLTVPRALFFFYMTPIAPFMMIGLARLLGALRDSNRLVRVLVYFYLAVGIGILLWYFYPVLAARGLPQPEWRGRMWFKSWI